MADESRLDEPGSDLAVLTHEAAAASLVSLNPLLLVPLVVVLAACFGLRQVARRRAFGRLAPADRELLVQALLLVIHSGAVEKGQSARGYPRKPARVLGDLLGLDVHTVDEALRRLIGHGYLDGLTGSRFGSLTTHLQTTAKGRRFHERHFGTTGGVFEAASLGLVVISGQSPRFGPLLPAPDAMLLRRTDNRAEPPT